MISEKIICAGFGGQGVMLLGQLLAYAANERGFNTLWYPSYGPETRGGTANCSVTISEVQVNSPVISKADTVIVMNKPSLEKFEEKVKPQGKLFVNSSLIDQQSTRTDIEAFYIPVNEIAGKLGNFKVANMVMLGAYLAKTQLFDDQLMIKLLENLFGEKKAHLIGLNHQAITAGRDYYNQNYK